MSRKKLIFYAILIFIVHFLLQALSVGYSFIMSMQLFDNPDTIIHSELFKYEVVDTMASILTFPLIPFVENTSLNKLFQGGGGILVFILNSFIWGLTFYGILNFITKKKQRRKSQKDGGNRNIKYINKFFF